MCKVVLLQEPRHQITLLCFLATFTAYVERVGFSIAYTAMAKQVNVSESVKGTVLSAFYWGYGVSQVVLPFPSVPLERACGEPNLEALTVLSSGMLAIAHC